jgi:predicted alpha/beta hydrolase family esterase
MSIELNKQTNCPVIGISHTGHVFNDNHRHHRHNVAEQISHKIQYLENHLFTDEDLIESGYDSTNTDIILIGHSIGCFIILEILEKLNSMKAQVKKSILLFPTIERMSSTPNGRPLTFLTTFFMWLLHLFALIASKLPDSIRKLGINVLFARPHSNKLLVPNANKVVNGMLKNASCMRSCLFMGRDEMKNVNEPNRIAIERHMDKLIFYYGRTDKWCPIDYYNDMERFVESKLKKSNDIEKSQVVKLDTHGMDHAFCLFQDQCSNISKMIHCWINE